MGMPYFQNDGREASWTEVTREERFFCAELYYAAKGNEREFVKWLNLQKGVAGMARPIEHTKTWEIGYEVCFYRDVLKSAGVRVRTTHYSEKRTFDLCLFACDEIVVIEAKAQKGFLNKQIDEIVRDVDDVNNLLGFTGKGKGEFHTQVIALVSSKYLGTLKNKNSPLLRLNGYFTWLDLYEEYHIPSFKRADEVYRD